MGTIAFGKHFADDPRSRLQAFTAGARMVTDHIPHIEIALHHISQQGTRGGILVCPECSLGGLTEDELHFHYSLYHTVDPNTRLTCPVCGLQGGGGNLALHIHNSHGPPEAREPPVASRAAFAWVVCHRADGRFLMVNEPAGISRGAPRYWLPAGRLDIGESLVDAARRETLEEGGVEVRIAGVLRFMISGLLRASPCVRVIFLASPVDESRGAVPKTVPDWESAGAIWVDVQSLRSLRSEDYRSPDPAKLFPAVVKGTLRPHPIETPAFRYLDEVLIALTKGESDGGCLMKAWQNLQSVYPSDSFCAH